MRFCTSILLTALLVGCGDDEPATLEEAVAQLCGMEQCRMLFEVSSGGKCEESFQSFPPCCDEVQRQAVVCLIEDDCAVDSVLGGPCSDFLGRTVPCLSGGCPE